MAERQYVPHAKTGQPVPVLTLEEQAQEQAKIGSNPWVEISGFKCHCGLKGKMRPSWLAIDDQLSVKCGQGHTVVIRFLPETVS